MRCTAKLSQSLAAGSKGAASSANATNANLKPHIPQLQLQQVDRIHGQAQVLHPRVAGAALRRALLCAAAFDPSAAPGGVLRRTHALLTRLTQREVIESEFNHEYNYEPIQSDPIQFQPGS